MAKQKKPEVVGIPNPPGPKNLANDRDFMRALHDFQYGTEEESEAGFKRMTERTSDDEK